jgi:hypothetical protein
MQSETLGRISSAVRGHLRLLFDGRVPADINSVATDIIFSVASIIDGSGESELDDAPVIPVLAFAKSDDRDELIFPEIGYGSWMHEYAHGEKP